MKPLMAVNFIHDVGLVLRSTSELPVIFLPLLNSIACFLFIHMFDFNYVKDYFVKVSCM